MELSHIENPMPTRHHERRRSIWGLATILWLSTLPAAAVDGVREINQSCAAVGCWPGDDPGLPVQIVETGSYRLTSGLILADENTTGILVSADNVSIDLNGFTVRGPSVVTLPSGPECSAPGSGVGIDATTAGLFTMTEVHNGFVVGTGSGGIVLGHFGDVRQVSLRDICGPGIMAGDSSSVVDSRVMFATGDLIALGGDSRVSGVTARFGNTGIYVGARSNISNSIAGSNFQYGISAGFGTVVSSSTITDNSSHGIRAWGANLILANTIVSNYDWGVFSTSADTGFGGNVFDSNTDGGINMGAATQCNVYNGTSLCPTHP